MKNYLLSIIIILLGTCLTAQAQLTVTAISSNNTCPTTNGCGNGVIKLNVSGASNGYTINYIPATCGVLVQDSIKELGNNTYTITVTDGLLNTTTTVINIVQASPSVSIISNISNVCNGSSIVLNAVVNNAGSAISNYCNSAAAFANGDKIISVSNGLVTNTSNCNSNPNANSILGKYSDYTGILLSANPGSTLPLSIQVDTCLSSTVGGSYLFVYIDYNHNGSFADANEQVFINPTVNTAPFVVNASIAIPANVAIGHTRMRIVLTSDPSATACSIYPYGETEDYTVLIGSNPYTYTWQPGASNTSAIVATPNITTVYTLTASINNTTCVLPIAIKSIAVNALPTVSTTTNNALCSYATISATSPTAQYYTWQPGGYGTPLINNLASTTYTVTAFDANNCTATSTAFVSPAPLIVTNATVSNINCFGSNAGVIILNTSGGNPGFTYTYNGINATNNVINNLVANTYAIITTDVESCVDTILVSVTQPSTPLTIGALVINATQPGAINGSAKIIPTGGTAPYSYAWVGQPNNVSDSITQAGAGTFTCVVTDGKGCTAATVINITDGSPSNINTQAQPHVAIIPNPCSNVVYISSKQAINYYTITSITGQVLVQQYTNAAQLSVNTTAWPRGMYLLHAYNKTYKIIKQ
jgi:large repetitive protein